VTILFAVGIAALAERVRAGDRAAFAELYREFADRIYGFCDGLLRDRDEAADATHDTFVLAAQRIGQLRNLERLGPWMFAIARHVCFRRLEQRRRVTPTDLAPDVLVLEDEVTDSLSPDDAAALVWAAADGLNERDRAVLFLNTHEGLEGAELAAALGVHHSNPYSMLHRAKAQLERALGVLLVARLGRRDCAPLAEMLDGWDGVLTPLLRKRLARHVEACSSCRATRLRANPLSVFAAAPLVRPSRADALGSTARVFEVGDLLEIAARRPETHERWQRNGFPPPLDARKRRRRSVLVAVAGLSVGIALIPLAPAFGRGQPARHRGAVEVEVGVGVAKPRLRADGRRTTRATTTTTRPRIAGGSTAGATNEPSRRADVAPVAGAQSSVSVLGRVAVAPTTTAGRVLPVSGPPTTGKPPDKVTTTTKAPVGTTSTTIGDT
jgi:RNA polymerase sigma factor (sigma-70 family)